MSGSVKRLAVLLVLLAALLPVWWMRRHSFASRSATENLGAELLARYQKLEARENEMDRTVWAKEILAENCGRVFESLWDSLNAATNKLRVLGSFSIGELIVSKYGSPEKITHGIEIFSPTGNTTTWSPAEWQQFLQQLEQAGWQLVNTEFRQLRFDTDTAGQPRQSHFYFRAHLLNSAQKERAVLEGDLKVSWAPKLPGADFPTVKQADTSGLTIKTRRGDPPFVPILNQAIKP